MNSIPGQLMPISPNNPSATKNPDGNAAFGSLEVGQFIPNAADGAFQIAPQAPGGQDIRKLDDFCSVSGNRLISPPKPSQSLRIHLIIRSDDHGLEQLYQELANLQGNASCGMHIKRLLFAIILGQHVNHPAFHSGAQRPVESARGKSFHINFYCSRREIGLESLYGELSCLPTSRQRNQHVKRMIFNAYMGIQNRTMAAQPAAPVADPGSRAAPPALAGPASGSSSAPVVLDTNNMPSPWSSPETAPTSKLSPEMAKERRKLAHLASMELLKS